MTCLFCSIIKGEVSASVVFEDKVSVAFLDHRPLFPGHCLLVPKSHVETLSELPKSLVAPVFENVQLLAQVVETALGAEGSFVAINNRVSQSVPHLHVHVVPRKKGDGLKGFFWPRNKYENDEHMVRVQQAIKGAIDTIQQENK